MTSRETKEIYETPTVKVVEKETVERHIKPVVTEVHEKKIIEHVTRPETRVVKQPDTVVYINEELAYTLDSGKFNSVGALPLAGDKSVMLITGKNKRHMYGLSRGGDLWELTRNLINPDVREWKQIPTRGLKFKFLTTSRKKNLLFALGTDGKLYRFDTKIRGMQFINTGDTKWIGIGAFSKRKIYGIREDGAVLLLHLKRIGQNETTKIGEGMKAISVGGKHKIRGTEIWGLSRDNHPYRLHNNLWTKFNYDFVDISITKDNAVYAVGVNGSLYKWNGGKEFVRQSGEFKTGIEGEMVAKQKVDVPLTNVMAYKEGKKVFSIDTRTGLVLQMTKH